MKLQNSNLLMNVAGVDLTEWEMESIVGGVVVPWTQMTPKISQGAFLMNNQDFAGAVKLLNDTFSKVIWTKEATQQQREFTTFYNSLSQDQRNSLKSTWTQYQNDSRLSGLNSNVRNMINIGLV